MSKHLFGGIYESWNTLNRCIMKCSLNFLSTKDAGFVTIILTYSTVK